jgi:DNA-binding transcriptional LysR family regulator
MDWILNIEIFDLKSNVMSLSNALLSLDLATLRTFRLVYRLQSFSEAAEEINVKQSTVSYTIDRLRKVTGDQLFVRQGSKIVPTDRCREILLVVDRLLAEAENLVNDAFDPATSTGKITIGYVDYVSAVFLPQVLARIRAEAKNIEVVMRAGYLDFVDLLLDGQLDIALNPFQVERKGIYSQKIVDDDFSVCIMDKSHPLVGKRMTHDDLEKYQHLRAQPDATFRAAYIQEAEKRGVKIRTPMTVSGAADLPFVLKGTDLISGMPSRMAQKFADKIGIAAFPSRAKVDINMFWPAASHQSKLNVWIRNLIVEEVSKLPPPIEI